MALPAAAGAAGAAGGPVGSAIVGGLSGLTSLFGGLMDDARKRRIAQAEGIAEAAGTEASGMAGGNASQADRQARAFESMMANFGQALR
jgi:hypothetical protein